MIEVIDSPTATQEAEIRTFLAGAGASAGVCGEHDPRWLSVLRDGLGHRPLVILARVERPLDQSGLAPTGQPQAPPIVGYLPLALVTSRLFGRFLVSLPYLNRGGVVTTEPALAQQLIDRAVRLAADHDVDYLELRHGQPVEHAELGARRDEKVRMVLPLPTDSEALWKGLDAKVRNQIRKGEKSGLSIRWGGHELLRDFYRVFAVNMRDLGTPVYSSGLFAAILRYFPQQAELAVVFCADRPVAGALLIHDGRAPGQSQVPSASALRRYNSTNANMWMYHHLLLHAMERGSRQFDFGRSSEGSGTYRFKRQWGAQPQPTVWQYHVRRGDIQAMRPDSPKYQRRIAIWQRLPVWVTRLAGPAIVKGIP